MDIENGKSPNSIDTDKDALKLQHEVLTYKNAYYKYQRYVSYLEWYIEVSEIFYCILYRDPARRMEAPKYMRKITPDGIRSIFDIYARAKEDVKCAKDNVDIVNLTTQLYE